MIRAIGGILRGRATPLQIILACVLGSMIGFMPSFEAAPGLLVALLLLLIILNANLGLAALVAAGAKLLSLAIMSLTFKVGQFLLDGPTTELFARAINAPVLALFGFEYYVTTGGLAIGFILGLTLGLLVSGTVRRFQRMLAAYEVTSEAFKTFTTKPLNRFIVWLFFGKGAKGSFAEIAKRRFGLPIRVMGVLFAGLTIGLLVIGYRFLAGPITTSFMRAGLERANGATVDLASAEIDPKSGRITLTGLAVCDASEPTTDIFRASTLEGDLSGRDLLRKRITMDRIVAVDAMQGATRDRPGVVFRPPSKPAPTTEPGEKSLEDYIKEAQEWKERLSQARRWLEEINKRRPGSDPSTGPDGAPAGETLEERLRRLAKERGYARVIASHLIEGAPTFLVKELVADGVKVSGAQGPLAGQTLNIRGSNLSTQPWLVQGEPRIVVTSSGATLNADVAIGAASAGTGPTTLNLALSGISADLIGAQLIAIGGTPPISGGTMDVNINANLTDLSNIDIPLGVTLNNTTLAIAGVGQANVARFTLPIGLRGELDNPRIAIDPDVLAQSLMQAGAGELANRVKGEAQKAVDEAIGKATDQLGDKIGGEAGKVLDGLLGGRKKGDK